MITAVVSRARYSTRISVVKPELASVSKVTASKALADRYYVGAETRKRVVQAARDELHSECPGSWPAGW
jgi:hypothetical protein